MAPRVQIPISPPLHMNEAPGMHRVPGALSFLASIRASPCRVGEKAMPWFRMPAGSCCFPRNAASSSFVLPFLLLLVVVPSCLGFVGALSAHSSTASDFLSFERQVERPAGFDGRFGSS